MSRRLRTAAVTLLCLAVAVRPAASQDDPDEQRAVAAEVQRLRNNPFLGDAPDRVRTIVQRLMERRTAAADEALRELLRDPATRPTVVGEIALLTIVVPPHGLLPEVLERLRTDAPSEAERRLEAPLVHASPECVRRLAEAAQETARSTGYRATAVRLLGRTGDGEALAVLADLWAGPEREIREAAREAFEAIVPGGATTAEEARAFVDRVRRDDLPLAEVLRRRLRDAVRNAASPSATGVRDADYEEMALALLPQATLDQVLRNYLLGAPVASVRAAAVRRLATFPYDTAGDPDGRPRAARALFAALRREDSGDVEDAILGTLSSLASAVRGGVAPEEMDALLLRIRPGSTVRRETRALAVRLAGELRDERAVDVLERAFREIGEGDADMARAVLLALQEIPVDRTEWLVARVAEERRPAVLDRLLALLGRSRDPSAVKAFASLLGDREHTTPETRRAAAKALATQWASASDAVSRDALVRDGLTDADPVVRATAAGALGIAGPGRETTLAALVPILVDLDADVRRAVARSVLQLDEAGATARLSPRFADDGVVFDVWREHVLDTARRDASPDRVLAAAAVLSDGNLRGHAIRLLESAAERVNGDARPRGAVIDRLAALYLDEGRAADAAAAARTLLAGEARTPEAKDHAEILLARALIAAGSATGLADAERRLATLAGRGDLLASHALETAAALGDVRLRLGDPVGAFEALAADASKAPAALRLRIEQLRADATSQVEAIRRTVLGLADALSGPAAADARTRLTSLPDAAWALSRELAGTPDFAAVRRLLAAIEVVTGEKAPVLTEEATPSQLADAVARLRAALAKVPRRSARPAR